MPDYTFEPQTVVDQLHAQEVAGTRPRAVATCAPTSSSSAALSLDLTGTLPTPEQVQAVRRRHGPEEARQADRPPARVAGVQLLLRQQVGRHPARQAPRPAGPGQGHVRLPRLDSRGRRRATSPTTSSPATSSAATGDEMQQPADGLVQGAADSPSSSWTTPPRCSSACAWPAPSATTTPTRSGARTTTGASPPSSAASAARTSPVPGGVQQPAGAARRPSSTSRPATCSNKRTQQTAVMKPLDGEPMDVGRRRRPAPEAGRLDGRRRRTRSSPAPWPTATGRTSSAAASSIRWTTCASPTRRATPSCSTPWPRSWSTTSTA